MKADRSGKSRASIIDAFLSLAARGTPGSITAEQVATRAGCGKGLVFYHFGSMDSLHHESLQALTSRRIAAWSGALAGDSTTAAVTRTSALLQEEHATGVFRAWMSLLLTVTDQSATTAMRQFGNEIGRAVEKLLEQDGVALRIPPAEAAAMLVAAIVGNGLMLSTGTESATVDSAWVASWLGVLGPAT